MIYTVYLLYQKIEKYQAVTQRRIIPDRVFIKRAEFDFGVRRNKYIERFVPFGRPSFLLDFGATRRAAVHDHLGVDAAFRVKKATVRREMR